MRKGKYQDKTNKRGKKNNIHKRRQTYVIGKQNDNNKTSYDTNRKDVNRCRHI